MEQYATTEMVSAETAGNAEILHPVSTILAIGRFGLLIHRIGYPPPFIWYQSITKLMSILPAGGTREGAGGTDTTTAAGAEDVVVRADGWTTLAGG